MIQLCQGLCKKWIEVNDLSSSQYSVKNIRFKTLILRSNLCDYGDNDDK